MPSHCRVWQETRRGLALKVRLTPKSARDEVSGIERLGNQAVLKARVRAVPDKGKANAALEKLIAEWLDVPASVVSLHSGARSRLKSVVIAGDTEALIMALENRVAELK